MSLRSQDTTHRFSTVLLAGLLFFADGAAAELKLTFGVYATDKPTVIVRKFKPLLNSLEQFTGERLGQTVLIKMQVASTYAKGIEDIISGHVDFSRLGPASYAEAIEKQPGLRILAVEAKKGKKRFNGVICVTADSPIQEITELKGKRFAFGNPRSTIGRYLSQQYLYNHGIRAQDLSHYEYLGRHDKVGTAVAIGQFDAGALKETTYERLQKNGAALRILATFPNITKPWIARHGLDIDVSSALKAALLGLRDTKVLNALKKDGFVEGDDADYAMIRQAINQNQRFFD